MKHLFVILICILLPLTSLAQPDTLWTRTFGGDQYDFGYSVQQTSDGGFIITGFTDSFSAGESDVYLIKTDALGIEQWNQTFGGMDDDVGWSVRQTSDGGYIISGHTSSYGAGGQDVYLIKTDASGTAQWTRTYGGEISDIGYSVQQTSDGGYIIAGDTWSLASYSDVYLIKTDPLGNEEWTQTFGGWNNDIGYSVQQTTDSGYIVTGKTFTGNYEVYLIKTDASGDELWSQTYGGDGPDEGRTVLQTDDGGYIIAGRTLSDGPTGFDIYLIKTDSSGIEEWTQTYDKSDHDYGRSVQTTFDEGYIILGEFSSDISGSWDACLIKTDAFGAEQWTKTVGSDDYEEGYSVQQTMDGGYIITGITGPPLLEDLDLWLVRLSAETGIIDPNRPQTLTYTLFSAYPNPFNPSTVISFDLPVAGIVELSVFNTNGRCIRALREAPLQAGHHSITFDATGLPSGIYFARLTAGTFQQTQKLVLLK